MSVIVFKGCLRVCVHCLCGFVTVFVRVSLSVFFLIVGLRRAHQPRAVLLLLALCRHPDVDLPPLGRDYLAVGRAQVARTVGRQVTVFASRVDLAPTADEL